MEEFKNQYKEENSSDYMEDDISENIIPNFIEVMDDDFNTAAAISQLFSIFKYCNNIMKNAKKANRKIVANTLNRMLVNLRECYSILGLFGQNADDFIKEMKTKYLNKLDISEEFINKEIEKRAVAKKDKDYFTADEIRANLDEKGIILNDTVNGTVWDIKSLYNLQST